MIRVQWFGHSMWKIWINEVSIVLDPFEDIGYPMPKNLTADIVTSSHAHYDHNNFALIAGKPQIVNSEGVFEFFGVKIKTIPTWHDAEEGAKRGKNLLFKFELAEKIFLHCGDLGHDLTADMIGEIGKIDVLMIPVGGFYTIDAKTALNIVQNLKPKIIFPMHYKTEVLDFPIAYKESYLDLIDSYRKVDSNVIELTKNDFKTQQTIIFNYK